MTRTSIKYCGPCDSDGLGEAYDRILYYASALEIFGGSDDDPICVSFGGKNVRLFAIGYLLPIS